LIFGLEKYEVDLIVARYWDKTSYSCNEMQNMHV
jgi:hypothetical protein